MTANECRLCDVAVFENRHPGTAVKFIDKSSLFILRLGVIRLPKLKLSSEQKVENMSVAPPHCQTASYVYNSLVLDKYWKEQRAEKDRKTE